MQLILVLPAIVGKIMRVLKKNLLEKSIIIGVLAIIFIVTISYIAYNIIYPQDKYFKDFDVSRVKSISVYPWFVSEEAKETTISEEDKVALVEQLKQVKLIGRGTDIFKYAQGCTPLMFHITLSDGSDFEFAASNPFYIIDVERGYTTEDYAICETICNTYYELVGKYCGRYRWE